MLLEAERIKRSVDTRLPAIYLMGSCPVYELFRKDGIVISVKLEVRLKPPRSVLRRQFKAGRMRRQD
jgi:hypothetical protein